MRRLDTTPVPRRQEESVAGFEAGLAEGRDLLSRDPVAALVELALVYRLGRNDVLLEERLDAFAKLHRFGARRRQGRNRHESLP